jgi:DNA-binding transcriptional LysR family regulator
LPQLLVELKHKQPLIDITLNELSNEIQIEMLQRKELDFGFVRISESHEHINSVAISKEHFSLVVPKDHPLKNKVPVDYWILKRSHSFFFLDNTVPRIMTW